MFKSIIRWKRRKILKQGITALRNLDYLMAKRGLSRHDRRNFWKEFCGSLETREKTFAKLERELKL